MDSPLDETAPLGPAKKSTSLFTTPLHLPAIWSRSSSTSDILPIAAKETTRKPAMHFPTEGLKVSALSNFIAVCGGEKKIKYLTTQQIVEKCILPVTAANKSSYCELIKTRDPSVVSHATAYISHSWSGNFMDTYRAIRYHFRNTPDACLWIDIFCLDQRIFYPKKIRHSKFASFGDAAGFVSTNLNTGADQGSSLFSPFRLTFGNGERSHGAESPGASSTGGASINSTYSVGVHEEDAPTAQKAKTTTKASVGQWNGLHTGAAGDWCTDILKHGIDQIGHVVLIVNPNPNPEPKSGNQGTKPNNVMGIGTTSETDEPPEPENEQEAAAQSPKSSLLWEKSRYTSKRHALNRLWCLYEVYCTTVDRTHTLDVSNVGRAHSLLAAEALAGGLNGAVNTGEHLSPRVASRGLDASASHVPSTLPKRDRGDGAPKKACTFDIAMHYSVLSDGRHNSSANVKNRRSPFTIDLAATCRDFEHLMKWVCAIQLENCSASDASDAERLLHIINVDVGATIFIDTVRNVLSSWVVNTMNENSVEIAIEDAKIVTYTNTLLNTSTNKQRLYIQQVLCNMFHVKGDTFRAEGALIELSEQEKGKMGPNHPDYLDSLQYLAEFYLDLNRHTYAEPILIECLERRKNVLGPQNPDTIHTLDLLANLYDVLGTYHLAEPLFEECFELRRQTLGPLHINTLKSMFMVSCMMFNQAEYELAESMMRECLDLRRSALGGVHLDTIASLQKLGLLYEIQKDFPAAELVYHEYLHASTAVYGNDHVNTITALYLLGMNYKSQYKYSLAEQVLRVSVDKYKATLSADHDCTLQATSDLAALYDDVGQYEHSLAVRSLYFDLCKARFGEEVHHKPHKSAVKARKDSRNKITPIEEDAHVRMLAQGCAKTHQCMYDLAGLHIKMGKCPRALPLLTRCLELRLQHLGVSHLDTLATQNQLAYVHINSGNYDAAEALLVQTIEEGSRMNAAMQAEALIAAKAAGKRVPARNQPDVHHDHHHSPHRNPHRSPRHSDRQDHHRNDQHGSFDHDTADGDHQHVRFSADAVLGDADYHGTPYENGYDDHNSYDNSHEGSHYSSNRSLSNNEEPPREDVEMQISAVLDAMNNLGLMYTEQGKLTEAEALFMSAWESYRRLHSGDTHPDVLTVVHNLAGLYVKQRKYELAEFFFTDCLKKRTAALGALHPATLHTLCNMSALYTHLGKFDIAENLIQECQAQCTTRLGADHPTTLRNINNLAANCEARGDLRRAEVLYKQCLVKRRLSLGANHPETLSSNNNLAALYVTQLQQFKEAERMFKECLKARQSTVGLRHPDTLSTINNLATLYLRAGRDELAQDVYIDCTEECIEQLGRAHPVTSRALANLQHLVGVINKDTNTSTALVAAEDQDHRHQQDRYPQDDHQNNGKLTIHTTPSPKKKGKKHRHKNEDAAHGNAH